MRYLIAVVTLTTFYCAPAQPAFAVAKFQKVFFDQYLKEHKDEEYAKYVKTKVKCYVCHQGKKKKNHNPYGQHLVELLDKKKDLKDVKKITAAIEKVGKLPSNPKDKKSPTYAELIAKSKLPGGELEELKKDPKEAPEEDAKKDEEEKE
ncbi:hypothetical protein OAS39_00085 [Pirellulales bacterium]|nr:hypothetical protein [Pirellulales bacterium]